jgi:TrmH family RNA methyltransferase
MPPLEPYTRLLPYSYAAGLFPAMEALNKAPASVSRVLLHSKLGTGEGAQALMQLCEDLSIRTEVADKALRRISGKDNVFAAAVFNKVFKEPDSQKNHLVLVSAMDAGNLGTILRTALGLGYVDVALILPCADPFDPQVVRASMGAVFSLRIREYQSFDEYSARRLGRVLYPFMLDGSLPLKTAVTHKKVPFSLIFGNEGSGLPHEYSGFGTPVRIEQTEQVDSLNLAVAAGIGMYAFREL